MGLFNKDYKDNSEKSYEDVKKCLKPKMEWNMWLW